MAIKALTYDTGGTVLDWHTGISTAFREASARHGLERDWAEITNDYRRRSLKGMINQVNPGFNIDDVHRRMLDEIIEEYDLTALTDADRYGIWHAWHTLDAWPGFRESLARIRKQYSVASFTILSVSLIMDTARKNGLDWDAVISCEMIGTYKVNAAAYETCAKWLALDPGEILMVACHNFDLRAAKASGFQTAFVRRPDEWGVAGPPDPEPDADFTFIVDDFAQLADAVGA